MEYNLISNIATCYSDIPRLLYYSHIPAVIVVLLFGIFVLLKSKEKRLASKILFSISIVFSVWVLLEGTIWLVYNSMTMMFLWSFLGLLYVLIHILSLYFVYAMIDKRDISFKKKIILAVLFFPTVLLTPTNYNLSGFDIISCSAIESNYFIFCRYLTGVFLIVWIIVLLFLRYKKAQGELKKQIRLLGFGILSFLFLFSWSEISGSLTLNWDITQYGLFGAPIFVAFLAYLVIRYKVFNIKLLITQALVAGLFILIGSQFFFIQNSTNKILTGISLGLVVIFGGWLARSVKKEVEQREKLESLTEELQTANLRLQELDKQKTEFLSIASHQMRTPLSIAKGYLELIKDGAYGKPAKEMVEILDNMDQSNEHLIKLIDEFLDISRIEQGRTKYIFAEKDLVDLVDKVVEELNLKAKDKNLPLKWRVPSHAIDATIDEEKIRHVVYNFVDNAIKYTPEGEVSVSLKQEDGGYTVRVADTGIGFGKVDEANFFQKFYRGNNVKGSNVTGTGLGLFVCLKFIEAHGGRVWAHSKGLGKGSEFGFWVPEKK